MTPGVRKLALTTHIASWVGWLGAVAGFLGLALVGLRSDDPDLVLYTETLELLADRATTGSGAPVGLPSSSPVLHSAAALVLLLAATGLAVYKPRGVTRHGWRKSLQERPRS